MAYDKKQYVRVNWKNKPSTATPLDEVNLNNMDNFLNVVDNTLIQFEAQKLNIATANSMIASLTIDTDSGIITAKQLDGTTFTWDLNIEKIPVSFSLSEDGILTMITEDGTEWTCDIAELIKEYVFDDSETIAFTREISEEDGSIHIGAAVKEGSIKSEHLNPDYRADIQEYTNQAEQAANESLSFSKDAKRWAVGDEEYEGSEVDNSKYYKEQAEAAKIAAEQARDEAQAATGAVIATTETVGVVKPDGESIEIAEDGTIKAPLAQTDKAGIIKPDNQTIGVEEDGTIKLIAKAANLPITDMQGLVGEENQETTTQLLINAIAEKVANQLVTNDALTTQLANYVTKAMMSNIQANDQTKVPTSALVYGMNEDISELNSNLQPLVYGIGKRIPENADLNDYTEPGVYYSQNAALTNTLKNVPDGVVAGFRLEVKTVSATRWIKQILYLNNTLQYFFIRGLENGTVHAWRRFESMDNTGWQDLALTSQFALYSDSSSLRYRKIGKTVEIIGTVKPAEELDANTDYTIATLPSGYRPKADRVMIMQGSSMNRWQFIVKANGQLRAGRYGTTERLNIPTSAWLPLCDTFVVD